MASGVKNAIAAMVDAARFCGGIKRLCCARHGAQDDGDGDGIWELSGREEGKTWYGCARSFWRPHLGVKERRLMTLYRNCGVGGGAGRLNAFLQ
jgi:hypothetical protein